MSSGNDNGENRVAIRPVRPKDIPALYEVARHPEVARLTMSNPSLELVAFETEVRTDISGRHYLVAELEGQVVGQVILRQSMRPRRTHKGTLQLMVHPAYWGQGVGSTLTAAALDLADNWLNLQRVELEVFAENEIALKLCEKYDFKPEVHCRCHTFGPSGWMDMIMMARLHNANNQSRSTAAGADAPRPTRKQPPFNVDQVLVRPPFPEDVEDVYQIFRHPLVARTTLQMPSQEIAISEERMNENRSGLYRLVANLDGRVIGLVSLFQPQNPRRMHAAYLGMAVHPDFWGYGVGSLLMSAIIDLADNWLQIKRVELEVNVDNPAGIRLYQKYGFEVEGTLRLASYGGGWTDNYFMARLHKIGVQT